MAWLNEPLDVSHDGLYREVLLLVLNTVLYKINLPGLEANSVPLTLSDFNEIHNMNC